MGGEGQLGRAERGRWGGVVEERDGQAAGVARGQCEGPLGCHEECVAAGSVGWLVESGRKTAMYAR